MSRPAVQACYNVAAPGDEGDSGVAVPCGRVSNKYRGFNVITLADRRVAIYARHSTSRQDPSVPAQLERCRKEAAREGATVVAEYADRAKTGAVLASRPQVLAMLTAAETREFDGVLMEDLSRISRDQADVATIHKVLAFHDVPLFSVTEGEINELHIGLRGTMNALALRDLSDKTRRGQFAAVAAGRPPGGRLYGYEVVRAYDQHGRAANRRRIDGNEAEVVRRVFREAAMGKPTRAIARDLNRAGIPSPSGKLWTASRLLGTRGRFNGLLTNSTYTGRVVFGRTRVLREPITGKRICRPQPPADWVVVERPELRIVSPDLFEAVQKILAGPRNPGGRPRTRPEKSPAVQTRHLTSGRTWCASCGARVTNAHSGYLVCRGWKEYRTCDQRNLFRRDEVIERTLDRLITDGVAYQIRIAATAHGRHIERHHAATIDILERTAAAARQAATEIADLARDAGRTDNKPDPADRLADSAASARRLLADIEDSARDWTLRPIGVTHDDIAAATSAKVAAAALSRIRGVGTPDDDELLIRVLSQIRLSRPVPGEPVQVRVSIDGAAAWEIGLDAVAGGE